LPDVVIAPRSDGERLRSSIGGSDDRIAESWTMRDGNGFYEQTHPAPA